MRTPTPNTHVLATPRPTTCLLLLPSRAQVLVPHLPSGLVDFAQKFGVRWGPYSLRLSTRAGLGCLMR